MDGKVAGDAGAGSCQAVVDEDAFETAKCAAANVFCDGDAAEAEAGGTADYVAGEMFFLVPLDGVGGHLLGGKGEGQVADFALFGVEGELGKCTWVGHQPGCLVFSFPNGWMVVVKTHDVTAVDGIGIGLKLQRVMQESG